MARALGAGYTIGRPPRSKWCDALVTEMKDCGSERAAYVCGAETGAFSAGKCIDAIGPEEGLGSMCRAELPQ
jgi:hypothetical protein